MEKESYRPGLSSDKSLVEQLKEYEKKPNSLVFASLAETYRSKGLVQQALEICDEGLEKHPEFAYALVVKARCFFDQRRYANCLEVLSEILRRNPENIKAEKLRSDVYQRLGQKQAAIGSLTRIISLMPSDSEAIKSLEELENLDPSPPLNPQSIIRVSTDEAPGRLKDFQVQQLEKWNEFFDRDLVSTDSSNEPKESEQNQPPTEDEQEITFATRTIAELYLRQGLAEKAKKVLEKMLQKDKNDAWALQTLEKLSGRSVNKVAPQAKRVQLMLQAQYMERLLVRMRNYRAQRAQS